MADTASYEYRVTHGTAQLPCQNCGKMVTVWMPFIGCVFCADCQSVQGQSWSASAEDMADMFRKQAKGEVK